MAKPFVSVLVTVRNGERYLSQALESIMAQTYDHYEIILVDGQSEDKTAAIAKSYPLRYLQQESLGLAPGRNTGILAAQGELIAFLDHDDLWSPQKLETQVKYLENSDFQGSVAQLQFFLEASYSLRPGFKQESLEQPQVGYTPGTLMVRREIFQTVGLFDPQYDIGCDADWFARLKDSNIAIKILDDVLLRKRLHHTNLSNNVRVSKQELFQVVRASIERQRNLC